MGFFFVFEVFFFLYSKYCVFYNDVFCMIFFVILVDDNWLMVLYGNMFCIW